MAGPRVFFTGVTGYIGGTVFQTLLTSSNPPSQITPLIRSPEKASLLTSSPAIASIVPSSTTLTPLIGSLSELDKLRDSSAEADVVVNCADFDDLPGMKAMLEGQKKRFEKTGEKGIFIHTSGTGALYDDARGDYPGKTIYTDLDPSSDPSTHPSISTLDATAPHRDVDWALLDADAEGYVKAYIVYPSGVWGFGQGPVFEEELSYLVSSQTKTITRIALDRGRVGVCGTGANIWNHINITDLGTLYALVYSKSTSSPPSLPHGRQACFFGAAGEYTLLFASQAVGKALKKYGILPDADPEPEQLGEEEVVERFGGWWCAKNTRGVAENSKSIGWTAVDSKQETFLEHIEGLVKWYAKQQGYPVKE
ncbi:hypothetical protein L202_05669 [Cryptococcus amylolentus CBS 6039]|uniref:NAD-dependent epimerase/dehydratase domain-containing protein n=1 Tax=Cryptococcus amylolentus CBS 6039 TaxID=1295533 RepID=A0A1E3HLC4_9TREE|nr:hypothetical protein L202_05669 [Cryptococcus amylolentus CBS 6039]ODN77139.1 hypothetical protein L202_05669 [Cryptococcus amylolentus CBS 6039]